MKNNLVMMVATLLMATNVWAGGDVRIIKQLNGTVDNDAGTVISDISDGKCTLTVTPADGNYITVEFITAERTIVGDLAQTRLKAPDMNGNDIEVDELDVTAGPSGTTTYKFTMPAADYDVEVVADLQTRTFIGGATVTLAETEYDYDGNAKTPEVSSVVLGTTTLSATTDYTVSYSNNIAAGTATVTVTGQGIYTGEATATFTINKAALSALTVSITGWTYGAYKAEDNTPSVQGNNGNGTVTYTYAAQADVPSFSETIPTNAGPYIVKATVAETDNYSAGEATTTFNIAKANITPEVTIQNWTYGDVPSEPVVEGNPGNGALTITYQGDNDDEPTTTVPTNAGGYTVFVSVAETANYNGGETFREFSIEQADFSEVIIANIADQTYTGNPITPTITVTFNDNPVDASDYNVEYASNTNVGTATITLTTTDKNFTQGDTNPSKTFQIVAAQGVITLTTETQTETYNGSAQQFTSYEVDNGFVVVNYYASETDRTANTNKLEPPVNAGTYYVQLTQGDNNYTSEPVDATFTIAPKSLSELELWTEFDGFFIYDGTAKTLSQESYGLNYQVNSETVLGLTEGTDFTVAYSNNSNVGTATMTLTGQGNYQGTATYNFNIVRNLNFTFNVNRHWATYYADENLQIPEGLKAYIVTNVSESEVTVAEITYIPQHVGVLLNYENKIEELPDEFLAYAFTGTTSTFDNNLMEGTSEAKAVSTITGGAVYVLYNDEFVKSTTGNIPANHAYLVVDDSAFAGQGTRPLVIVIDEYAGISDVTITDTANGQYYNLQGMRMAQPRKGLVIVNGKKMFVK
jgi:hypothetical protein